jgi:hypothetical protein
MHHLVQLLATGKTTLDSSSILIGIGGNKRREPNQSDAASSSGFHALGGNQIACCERTPWLSLRKPGRQG